MDFAVYLSALGLAAGQIVGIGPQNAYVIRQGIGRSHVLPIVLVCILCDVFFIAAGVWGVGAWISRHAELLNWVIWGGAAFITFLGVRSLRSALTPKQLDDLGGVEKSRNAAIKTILLVTLVNPYVWIDTVVLIGSVSSAYGAENKGAFLLGCLTASLVWFFGIGFFAGKLAPWFASPKSWRILDGVIACIMFLTAGMLVLRFGLH